ncbi:MAG: ABC transporter ATP-binding protein [Pseudomonadota bacterium]
MVDQPILDVAGLSKSFGGIQALKGVDLGVRAGEIFGLLGPNGAGKTTLFNMMAGYLPPSAGRVTFLGKNITALKPHRRAAMGLARTFQITQPFPELTVEENVMVGASRSRPSIRAARAAVGEWIDVVGLGEKRHALGRELSTGQRKRLELARALSTDPKLLLLDEITGGVDQKSIPGLVDLVRRLRDLGVTLVMIEHNMSVISDLADRMMFLNRGEPLATGTPKDILAMEEVADLYLGDGGDA